MLCMCFVALIGKLIYINVCKGDEYRQYSYNRQTSKIILHGSRGAILDRRYRVLAGSADEFIVYADPQVVDDHAEAAAALSGLLKMPPTEICDLIERRKNTRYVVLWRGSENLRKDIAQLGIRGLGVQRAPKRTYPMGTLAAHLLGHVNAEGKGITGSEIQGLEGIEKACNARLKDTPGQRKVFCDGQRRPMYQEADSYIAPKDGAHVVLTIDVNIQEKLEEQLKARVEHHNAASAVGVVMDPKTGEILAMANYPTFDPGQAGKFPLDYLRNRVLTDPAEPGSSFKPFVMAAVLTHEAAKRTEVINCHNGVLTIGKRQLHDSHPYGALTVDQVLAKSSNIGMAILGTRIGNKKIHDALHLLGFGEKTGIDLLGENKGLMQELRKWMPYSTASVSMGQEIAITPIQLITAFGALINGGRLYRPRVVAAVISDDGELIEDRTKPEERWQAVEPAISRDLVEMMSKVVTEGTAKQCALEHWQVLGKTGTAQIPRFGGRGYESGAYLATFVGAAPASDPAVAVLVMVRHPKKNGYYGSQVSVPAVKEVLKYALTYLNVPHDLPAKAAQIAQAGVRQEND